MKWLHCILVMSCIVGFNFYLQAQTQIFEGATNVGATAIAPYPERELCGTGITLTANNAGATNYKWFVEGALISSSNTHTVTPVEINTYNAGVGYATYSVRAFDAGGTPVGAEVYVIYYIRSAATITYTGSPTFCTSGSVLLTATVPNGSPTYQWYRNSTLIVGATASTYNATLGGDYFVMTNYGCGSFSSPIVTVTEVTGAPSGLTLSSADGTNRRCAGGSLQLNSSLAVGAQVSYQWYRGSVAPGNEIVGATSNTYTVGSAEVLPTTYWLQATNGCGSTSASLTVSADAAPTALNVPSPTPSSTICEGQTATLQVVSVTNSGSVILGYEWYKDGVLVANSPSNLYTATESGTYTAKAYNKCGSTPFSTARVVTVIKPPTTAFIGFDDSPTLGCGRTQVRLYANSNGTPSGLIVYDWYLNNVLVHTGAFYDATSVGSYYITARENSGLNCATPIQSSAISVTTVSSPPTNVSFKIVNSNPCGGNVEFEAQASGEVSAFQWYKDGAIVLTTLSKTYTATLSGVYSVRAINACGNTPQTTGIAVNINVSALTQPNIVLIGGTNTTCKGAKITLSAQVSGNIGVPTYRWFRNNQLIQGATNATYDATESGNYVVETADGACAKLSNPQEIIIQEVPDVILSHSGKTKFCEGDSLIIKALSNDNTLTYTWSIGTQVVGTGNTYVAKIVGAYIINLTAKNVCGGTKTYSLALEITSNNPPKVEIVNGNLRTLESALYYQWRFNGKPIVGANTSTHTPLDEGLYSVVLTNQIGCSRVSEEINIKGKRNTEQSEWVWISPNPNVGNFEISILSAENSTIALYDNQGRLVVEKNIIKHNTTSTEESIQLSNIARGLYVLKVISGGRTTQKRIIVQ
ncbi:MAG: T9SS C-terminal target domain-containing protein [Cytophagales bacterium]|nr:MAG: T9SS C-terminal target domain-containing protein [Cytophagales bacterium]